MLEVSQLTKKFGRKTLAVDHVDLKLEKGEMCVLLGPNGAGKSTTIKSIAGLLRFQGTIMINGFLNNTIEAKRLVAYVPETPAIYDLLTVKEHIQFIEKVYKLTFDQNEIAELLHRFDMDDKINKLGGELSKGMRQKLSIILGVITKPKVILFDEPMVGLDPKAIKELKKLFEELVQRDTILLVSTHIIDSIVENYDRVLIMNEGKVVFNETKEGVLSLDKSLEDLFFEYTTDNEDVDQSAVDADKEVVDEAVEV